MQDDITKLVTLDLAKCFDTAQVIDNEELERTVYSMIHTVELKNLHHIFNHVATSIFNWNLHDFKVHITGLQRELEPVEKFNIHLSLRVRVAPIIKRMAFEQGLTGE